MLPPNLHVLDVHWMPGSASNTLLPRSPSRARRRASRTTRRCGNIGRPLVAGACGFELDATGYGYLAQSNAGAGNVALTIQGTDDDGHGRRDIVDVPHPVRAAARQRRRLLLGRHQHADHALRLRRRGVRRRRSFLRPGQYGTGGHVHRLPRAVAATGRRWPRPPVGQATGCSCTSTTSRPPATPLTADRRRRQPHAVRRRSARSGDQFVAIYGDGSAIPRPNSLYLPRRHDGAHPARQHQAAVVRARPPRVVAGRDDDRDDARGRAQHLAARVPRRHRRRDVRRRLGHGRRRERGRQRGGARRSRRGRPEQRDDRWQRGQQLQPGLLARLARSWSSRRRSARPATRRATSATATSPTT